MNRLVILYYTAGTGGDLVTSWLLTNSKMQAGTIPIAINEAGRVEVVSNEKIQKIFPPDVNEHWYNRSWFHDIARLKALDFDFVIQTVNLQQFQFLKEQLGNACTSITINYDQNIWQCVLKNFCSKVLDSDGYLTNTVNGKKFLQVVSKTEDDTVYYLELAKNKKLGLWYFEQYLKGNVIFPPKESFECADIVLSLDELLNTNFIEKNLQVINKKILIDVNASKKIYKEWLAKQDQLYTEASSTFYSHIVGYNKTLKLTTKKIKSTSLYDNLLHEYYH